MPAPSKRQASTRRPAFFEKDIIGGKKIEKTTPKDKQKAVASFRLKIIDVFFAAYGAFFSGLFCISQYFWGSSKYFVWIASTFFFVTLLATYILSYSKKTAKSETLLRYIQECANYVGVLNPVMLALGFILTISSDVYILAFCIVLEAVQLCCYFWSVKKVFPCLEFGFWNKIVTWCKKQFKLLHKKDQPDSVYVYPIAERMAIGHL